MAISTDFLRKSSQVVLSARSRARTHRLRCTGRHLLPPRLARVPVCYPNRVFTMDGGLISYGPDFSVVFRRVGTLVARIVRGERPEMIPVERPMQLELIVNKRAAHAIGLVVPEPLLARADEVIE
jgi:ABC-type uncharacterized transport system substrate-binding protein